MFDDKMNGFKPAASNLRPETVEALNQVASLVLAAQHLPEQETSIRKALANCASSLLDALPRGDKRTALLRAARAGAAVVDLARAWRFARPYEPAQAPFDAQTVDAMREITLLLWASEQLLERHLLFKEKDIAKAAKPDADAVLAAIRRVSASLLSSLMQPSGRRPEQLAKARAKGRAELRDASEHALEVARMDIAAVQSTAVRDAVAGPLRQQADRWDRSFIGPAAGAQQAG